MKKILISLVAAALCISTLSANAATRIEVNGPDLGVRMVENQELLTDNPNLMTLIQTAKGEGFFLCKTLDDITCTSGNRIKATSFLPPCSASINQNCINSLYAIDETGKRFEGSFNRYVAEGSANEFPANEKYNLPQGKGQGGIWKISGLTNGAGNEDYYVGARFDLWSRRFSWRVRLNT